MAGPSWLAGTFAAVMIVIAAYSASRLVFSRLRGRATEYDADALHAVMGAAMAGMLVPQLNMLPDSAWAAVFTMAAAWFGWHAIRAPRPGHLQRLPVPLPGAASDRMRRHALHAPATTRLAARARRVRRWPCPAWPHPPAQRAASPHSRSSSPCSCSATSSGPPTGSPPWPGPEPPQQTQTSAAITGQRSRPPRLQAATPRPPRHTSAAAARPGNPPGQASTRPQARRLLQDRDEHHHGLHAHPHALAGLSGTISGTRQEPGVAGQPGVTSVPPPKDPGPGLPPCPAPGSWPREANLDKRRAHCRQPHPRRPGDQRPARFGIQPETISKPSVRSPAHAAAHAIQPGRRGSPARQGLPICTPRRGTRYQRPARRRRPRAAVGRFLWAGNAVLQ